jgi:ATP-dependent DNA helicase RecG
VLREIRQDLSGCTPMRRMLQGDVGSGKTVVSACAILMALESGSNALMMVPTEILADQHYQRFRQWFDPLGLPVKRWTGSIKDSGIPGVEPTTPGGQILSGPERLPAVEPLDSPRNLPQLIIGTHALIETGFVVEQVGLVLIDEQHKFGVVQREALVRKGCYPHLLLLTATPIPRTLGLTVYGDLDLSVLDEKPGARPPIRTFVRTQDKLPRVWEFLRQKLSEGCQAYVVCPRLGDTDDGDLKAVRDVFDQLRALMAPQRVGLLHGQLKAEAKSQVMSDFVAHQLDLVVATSVVEVGLDVPNASILVVLDADRFGLAQLHQIRGRIGRGPTESYCIFVAEGKTELARQRLQILAETQDGFQIAEADLKLRGPGELLGQVQSGCPKFRFADLSRDATLLQRARNQAVQIQKDVSVTRSERGGAPA